MFYGSCNALTGIADKIRDINVRNSKGLYYTVYVQGHPLVESE